MRTSGNYEKEADYEGHILFAHYTAEGIAPSCVPHFHDSIELAFVIDGECRMHINAEEKILQKGEIGFANCFEPHFYKRTSDCDMYVLVVSAQYLSLWSGLKERAFNAFMPYSADAFKRIEPLLGWADTDWMSANKPMKYGFVNLLLGILLQYYPVRQVKKGNDAALLIKIMEYIDTNFAQPISLQVLSKRFGYAPNYISGLFNAFTGMNLREYVNRRRIREAIKMRGSPKPLPLCKIAEICGFESQNTFYRAYDRYRNETE